MEGAKEVFRIYDEEGPVGLVEAFPIILRLNMRFNQNVVMESTIHSISLRIT